MKDKDEQLEGRDTQGRCPQFHHPSVTCTNLATKKVSEVYNSEVCKRMRVHVGHMCICTIACWGHIWHVNLRVKIRSQPQMSFVSAVYLLFIFFEMNSSPILEFTKYAWLTSQQASGICLSLCLQPEITRACYHTYVVFFWVFTVAFYMFSEHWTQVSRLAPWVLHWLNYIFSRVQRLFRKLWHMGNVQFLPKSTGPLPPGHISRARMKAPSFQ